MELDERDATPEAVYRGRRTWLRRVGAAAGTIAIGSAAGWFGWRRWGPPPAAELAPIPRDVLAAFPGRETDHRASPITPRGVAGAYNNFFELGEDKEGVAERGRGLVIRPWTLEVSGECHRPRTFDVWDLVRRFGLEQRIYRHRCVEAWSMIVPWDGIALGRLLDEVEPTGHARFVRFVSFHRPREAPGQRRRRFPWPYHEGLRLDEAAHPLTFLSLGAYGAPLPVQHGAPVRLVVPWKYGFKGAKSIVRIELTRARPPTFWSTVAPAEYGFEANVNPHVPHPRWSQASERPLGSEQLRPTLLMNGYVEEVAGLYRSS